MLRGEPVYSRLVPVSVAECKNFSEKLDYMQLHDRDA